jgi:hypothetical protein
LRSAAASRGSKAPPLPAVVSGVGFMVSPLPGLYAIK